MCGIFSLIDPARRIAPQDITPALTAIKHRGPDGEGIWISADGHIALGHRRLSIIDIAGGAQPLHSTDGHVHLVINGEIYGHRAQRSALQARGHVFQTNSDSEVAINLYREYGLDFVNHLRGEFALVLVDTQARRVIAARDRFGIKPLVYTQTGDGRIAIASEAKAIFASGITASRWDQQSLYHALSLQYTPADRSVFDGINTLPPGHMMVWQDGNLSISRYWDVDFASHKDTRTADAQWQERFLDTLQESVTLRLDSDVPLCAHLSGGIDSASIAALATTGHNKPLDCFTVRFRDQAGYDEYPIAAEMAARIGANLHSIDIDGDSVADHLSDATYYSEGLSINSHLVGKYLLNRAIAAAGFKVALSGEGSDELLAGYPHLREDMLDESQSSATARQALYAGNTKLAGVFLAEGDTLDTSAMTAQLGFTPAFLRAKASLGLRLHALLDDGYARDMQKVDPYSDMAARFARDIAGLSRVDAASHLWIKSALATYILRTLGDGCEMPHAVEGRVPFLDHRLFELCRQMPLHLKIRDMREKYILREAMKPHLTATLYNRQKHPFIAPPAANMATPRLNNYINDTLASRACTNLSFFDQKKVATWRDNYRELRGAAQVTAEPVLMTLLTATALAERYGMSA